MIPKKMVFLAILFLILFAAGEATAAKVTVENTEQGQICEYQVAVVCTDQNRQSSELPPVRLAPGAAHTFDTGSCAPYLLKESPCMNNKSSSNGPFLLQRWISSISGDSSWRIETVGWGTCKYNPIW